MMSDARARRPSRQARWQRLFLAAALLLLALPGLLTLAQPPRALSELEARRLAAWPSPPDDLQALRAWPAAAEAWLQDHLGGRDWLLGRMAELRFLLQEPGETLVVFGRDGALFLTASARMVMAFGQSWLDPPMRPKLRALLGAWQATADAAGVPLLLLLVPDKETVQPEHLPWWARRFDAAPALDRLLAEIAAEGRTRVLDLRPALSAREAGRPAYLPEDTHWNGYGAWLGYRALVLALRETWPELTLLEGEAVAWREQASAQELRRMLGLPPSDDAFVASQPLPAAPAAELLSPPGDLRLFRSRRADRGGPRLLLLGDSYRLALLPWLTESFPTLVATGLQSPAGLAALLREHPSDLLVIQLVERNLGNPHVHGMIKP